MCRMGALESWATMLAKRVWASLDNFEGANGFVGLSFGSDEGVL